MSQTDAHFAKTIHCKKYYDPMCVISTAPTALYKSNGDYICQGYHIISYLFSFRESIQDYKNPYGYGKKSNLLKSKSEVNIKV